MKPGARSLEPITFKWHSILVAAIAVMLSSARAGDNAEQLAARFEELQKQYRSETNEIAKQALDDEIGQVEQKIEDLSVGELHDIWLKEADHEKKKEIGDALACAAIRARNIAESGNDSEGQQRRLDVIVEVAADGQFQQKQIEIPREVSRRELRSIYTIDHDSDREWVVRRVTAKRIEVWLPKHGWLFDDAGKLVAEARPPRRGEADGREWFGAFLPDGRWVTTDLWGEDKVLSFFSPASKWLKEIAGDKLVPAKGEYWSLPTIGWCRSTRRGDAFIASVGQDGGRGVAVVTWRGDHHVLRAVNDPWKLAFPRDLEPKGMYTNLFIPDDAGKMTMTRQEDGHGPYVGFPVYEAGRVKARIPDGEAFGFWPNSNDVYIVTRTNTGIGARRVTQTRTARSFTRGSIKRTETLPAGLTDSGSADTPLADGMLFVDNQKRVVTIRPDYAISGIEEFVWSDGLPLRPKRIFPDLRLGLFYRADKLELARW